MLDPRPLDPRPLNPRPLNPRVLDPRVLAPSLLDPSLLDILSLPETPHAGSAVGMEYSRCSSGWICTAVSLALAYPSWTYTAPVSM